MKTKSLNCIVLITAAIVALAFQKPRRAEIFLSLNETKSNTIIQQQAENDETKQYKKDVYDIQDLSQKKDLVGLIKLKDEIAV